MHSWTQRMYFAAPVWAQNALSNAYGLHLRYLRYGPAHRRHLQALRERELADAESVGRAQLGALRDVVRHAYATVPFYRERTGGAGAPEIGSLDDLGGLPIVRKDDLRRPRAEVTSALFAGERVQTIHTGGTTGKTLHVYCNRETLQRNYAFYGRLLAWAGIRGPDRIAVFAGRTIVPPAQSAPPYWRSNRANRSQLFSSYHLSPATLPQYVAELERFAPALIDSYPSAIAAVARYVEREGITGIRPRAIVTSSETLTDDVRALVCRAFGCPVFDYYGAAEMAAFISQCEQGRYHVNPEFGVVEILRDRVPARPGEVGEIVATGFLNPVMPLVRYATGDLAEQDGTPCGCGRAFPTVARVVGRMDDVVVTPDGREIGRLDPIFKAARSVRESRIVQDAADHVLLEVVPDGELPEAERADLLRELSTRLGPAMRIDIAQVPHIPRAGSGKLRTVVNQVRARA